MDPKIFSMIKGTSKKHVKMNQGHLQNISNVGVDVILMLWNVTRDKICTMISISTSLKNP